MDPDELMMMALDAGAEDFSEEEDSYEVITAPEDFSAVREALEAAGIPMVEADVTMIPQTWVELTDEESIKKMQPYSRPSGRGLPTFRPPITTGMNNIKMRSRLKKIILSEPVFLYKKEGECKLKED